MHTASSANRTCSARVSTSECTATVEMPSSRHARMMRSAISPRFAMRIFLNTALWLDAEERLPEFYGLSVLGEHLGDLAGHLALDLVHQLHRFDDAERLALAH